MIKIKVRKAIPCLNILAQHNNTALLESITQFSLIIRTEGQYCAANFSEQKE